MSMVFDQHNDGSGASVCPGCHHGSVKTTAEDIEW